jgi:hypothetical protein
VSSFTHPHTEPGITIHSCLQLRGRLHFLAHVHARQRRGWLGAVPAGRPASALLTDRTANFPPTPARRSKTRARSTRGSSAASATRTTSFSARRVSRWDPQTNRSRSPARVPHLRPAPPPPPAAQALARQLRAHSCAPHPPRAASRHLQSPSLTTTQALGPTCPAPPCHHPHIPCSTRHPPGHRSAPAPQRSLPLLQRPHRQHLLIQHTAHQ